MALKDLTEYLAPNLEFQHAGKTYTVPPPTKDVGLKLAAVNAYGANIATHGPADALAKMHATQRAVIEMLGESVNDIGVLSLGAAYDEMVADNVPGPHIDFYARYALYYWVLGEETADAIIAAEREAKSGPAPKAKAPARSKSGRSTASGSRKTTSTASRSTRTTASPKAQPGASFKKDPESGGENSSTTGA